jgi:general secretion pathway protein D
MIRRTQSRAPRGLLRASACLACCWTISAASGIGHAQTAEQLPPRQTESVPAQTSTAADAAAAIVSHPAESSVSKRQMRAADAAYMSGAKKLQHNDLDGAEHEFQRALQLNPQNDSYTIALSVTRNHRVSELVQHASKARLMGDDPTAQTLLAEARSIDPQNPLVIEHSGPFVRQASQRRPDVASAAAPETPVKNQDRPLATALPNESWQVQAPVLAGAIRLDLDSSLKSFDLRASSSEVLQNIAKAYGIRAMVDDSIVQQPLRFNLQHATYAQAMGTAMSMTHAFAVPMDEKTVIVAMDTPENRRRLERQLQETIYLPGLTLPQINDLAQIVRSIFEVNQASIEAALGKIVIRAPQDTLDPLNVTLRDLIDGSGEVMVEVKLYEVTRSNSITAGATIPTQFTIFNVQQAANAIVNSNQTLVQQAIAQGYVTAGTSNLEIALALIQLGLVQSSLATNLIGVFGGGILQTGISGSTATTINLGLNSSDTRILDDVQLRVGDHEDAIFREGEKYPITQSTYSTGVSNLPPGIGNSTINGTSVSSLISQYTGNTAATIPQITYEDLGITLKAKPVIEKSGRINLLLDLKIEALSGSSLSGNPILDNRRFATDLTVADGESALMVSDISKNESDAITGIPGLSSLPGFQVPLNGTRERDSSQLVVVVTPHIVRRRSNLIAGPRIPVSGPAEE